eukprot:3611165-Rhodomonas_salina.1
MTCLDERSPLVHHVAKCSQLEVLWLNGTVWFSFSNARARTAHSSPRSSGRITHARYQPCASHIARAGRSAHRSGEQREVGRCRNLRQRGSRPGRWNHHARCQRRALHTSGVHRPRESLFVSLEVDDAVSVE